MDSIVFKVLAIVVGSMIFPALGYYLDWRKKELRRKTNIKKEK
jgi:hypothetical protein